MRAILAAMLMVAAPAFAQDSQTRLEDILSGKADEKKDDKGGSTAGSSSSSSSTSDSSGGSSLVSSGPISQAFSLLTGRTVGNGKNVLGGNYRGLLGVEGFYLHGVSDAVDVGARLGFQLYPFEGALPISFFQPITAGFRIQGLLRVRFVQSGRISFGINFEPGFFVYFPSLYYTAFGVIFGVEAQVGIAISSALNIAVGLSMPVYIGFGAGSAGDAFPYRRNAHLVWPILAGGGIEYFVRSDLMLFAKFHIGPMINLGNAGGAGVGMDLKAGIGWKF
jgi:hypothetical protein